MATLERDVVLIGKEKSGNITMDFPVTRLSNIEDSADVKQAPAAEDYIPVVDSADGGQMKKTPWGAIAALFAKASHTHAAQTSVSGNAGTATKLKTARTIDGMSFDGSAAITHYGTCDTAAATAAKVVALTGFSLVTGARVAVKFTVTNTAAKPTLNVNSTGAKAIYYRGAAITAGYLAANRTYEFVYNGTQYELVGDVDTNTAYTAASAAPLAAGTAAVGTSDKYAREDHVHPAQTSVSGNSGTATKLKTARTIGGMSFDGSAAITHYGTCDTAAATAAKVVALTGFSLVTGARIAVKFTVTNTAAKPTLNVNSTGAKAIYYRGAAITAGYLAANRTYEFVYNGTQYELVGDIDTNTTYDPASTAPLAAGTAAVGTSAKYAREDHVHPAQTSVSGNAGTATKLKTARKIGNASFNGSADISLKDIGAAASDHTHTATDVGVWSLIATITKASGYSGTWTAPDVFGDGSAYDLGVYMIGGGGSGGAVVFGKGFATGGASGYGKNVVFKNVTPGKTYNWVIGKGGSSVSISPTAPTTYNSDDVYSNGNSGGTTSFGGQNAEGGNGGTGFYTHYNSSSLDSMCGSDGGQGSLGYLSTYLHDIPTAVFGCVHFDNSGTSQSPRVGQNQFDTTMVSLCAGGMGSGAGSLNYRFISAMPDGTKGGDGAANDNKSVTAQNATGYGNGGGGAAVVRVADNAEINYPKTATSGAGSDGVIYLYARRSS